MLKRVIATRYANAIFASARDKNILEAVEKDFPRVADRVAADADLFKFLTHPAISPEEKKSVLAGFLQGRIDATLYDAVCLIVDKGREEYIPMIHEEFRKLLMEHRGQVKAVVHTPYPLADAIKDEIVKRLSIALKKTVLVEEEIEPGLIGGIKVRVGDRIYDGSLASQLDRLRDSMMSAGV